jgi:small subunit ribosomal protein S6e
MVEFKVVLSDPGTGRAYNIDVSGGAASGLVGRRIGDEIDAAGIGLPGYRMQITGGSDRNGTPARKLLLAGGVGFRPVMDGERRRKAIRGNEITADFVQINARVISSGDKALEEYFAKPAPAEKAA